MPLTPAQAMAIMQRTFAFRCASGPADLGGAAYTLLDVKDAGDMFEFVTNPPASWDDHLYNACLFAFSLKQPGQYVLFLEKAGGGTGGSYDAKGSKAGLHRGDGRTLLKVPNVSGATILYAVSLDSFSTVDELFQWVRGCLDKKAPIPNVVSTSASAMSATATATAVDDDPEGLC